MSVLSGEFHEYLSPPACFFLTSRVLQVATSLEPSVLKHYLARSQTDLSFCSTMSLDMAQNASAVTDLVFAGLKVAGYGLVTVCSIFGSHTIKDYLDKEERMKKTVTLWRDVLNYLYEKKQKEFGQDGLRCMLNKLEQYVYAAFGAQLIEMAVLTTTTAWRQA